MSAPAFELYDHEKRYAAMREAGPELYEVLRQASLMCGLYAHFIRNHVKADDLELHPYLPELEQVEADADAALAKARATQFPEGGR